MLCDNCHSIKSSGIRMVAFAGYCSFV